jgi:hypothetical protein
MICGKPFYMEIDKAAFTTTQQRVQQAQTELDSRKETA